MPCQDKILRADDLRRQLPKILAERLRNLSGQGHRTLLTNAACQPFIAALSDIFGRREILLLSVFFFTVGSALCCAAKNFAELLAGRSIQGIGGGGIISMGIIIVTDIVPLRKRPKYSNFIQLAWAIGSLIGPLLGGLFAEYTTWRWIFYLNFPFCGICFVVIFFCHQFGNSALVIRSETPTIRLDRRYGFYRQCYQFPHWYYMGRSPISLE